MLQDSQHTFKAIAPSRRIITATGDGMNDAEEFPDKPLTNGICKVGCRPKLRNYSFDIIRAIVSTLSIPLNNPYSSPLYISLYIHPLRSLDYSSFGRYYLLGRFSLTSSRIPSLFRLAMISSATSLAGLNSQSPLLNPFIGINDP